MLIPLIPFSSVDIRPRFDTGDPGRSARSRRYCDIILVRGHFKCSLMGYMGAAFSRIWRRPSRHHRQVEPSFPRTRDRVLIAGIRVAHDAGARIVPQHASSRHSIGRVCDAGPGFSCSTKLAAVRAHHAIAELARGLVSRGGIVKVDPGALYPIGSVKSPLVVTPDFVETAIRFEMNPDSSIRGRPDAQVSVRFCRHRDCTVMIVQDISWLCVQLMVRRIPGNFAKSTPKTFADLGWPRQRAQPA
jgi:hypothetical protein